MLIAIIQFPKIKKEKENDFFTWFDWSNSEFMQFDGFLDRKLLKSKNGLNYLGILEVKDEETFRQIHESETHKIVFARLY